MKTFLTFFAIAVLAGCGFMPPKQEALVSSQIQPQATPTRFVKVSKKIFLDCLVDKDGKRVQSECIPAEEGAKPRADVYAQDREEPLTHPVVVSMGGPSTFSSRDGCLSAMMSGKFEYYKSQFLGNTKKNWPDGVKQKVAPFEFDRCVFMKVVGGKKWVVQKNGTEFRFNVKQDGDIEDKPYARHDCGNEVYEVADLIPETRKIPGGLIKKYKIFEEIVWEEKEIPAPPAVVTPPRWPVALRVTPINASRTINVVVQQQVSYGYSGGWGMTPPPGGGPMLTMIPTNPNSGWVNPAPRGGRPLSMVPVNSNSGWVNPPPGGGPGLSMVPVNSNGGWVNPPPGGGPGLGVVSVNSNAGWVNPPLAGGGQLSVVPTNSNNGWINPPLAGGGQLTMIPTNSNGGWVNQPPAGNVGVVTFPVINTTSGNLGVTTVGNTTGGSLGVTTTGGGLNVATVGGGNLGVTTTGGNLGVNTTGGSLGATTTGGNLGVNTTGGNVGVTTTGGSLGAVTYPIQ